MHQFENHFPIQILLTYIAAFVAFRLHVELTKNGDVADAHLRRDVAGSRQIIPHEKRIHTQHAGQVALRLVLCEVQLQDLRVIGIKVNRRHQQRVLLGVVAEITHDAIGFQYVAAADGILKLKHVEVLRDADVALHVGVVDAAVFGYRNHQLLQLVGYLVEVGAEKVSHHLHGFWGDAVAFSLQVVLYPARYIVVVQLLRLIPNATLVNLLGQGLAFVELLVFVDKDEQRCFGNRVEISLEVLQVLHVLRLFDNDHHTLTHHRERAGMVGDGLQVDIATVEHDLVEEVVRMIGLDNIPAVSLPHDKLPKVTLSAKQHNAMIVKHELADRGMLETVTWSFMDENLADMFRLQPDHLTLINPIATDLNEMRPSIVPNLLIGVKNNVARGQGNVALFEVGPQFYGRKPTEQTQVAAGVRYGLTNSKHWSHNERPVDIYDVKADALAAIAAANGPVDSAQITTDAPSYYHPGRSGVLRLGKNVLAYFGELHPSVSKKFGLKQRAYAFEVFLDNIPLPRNTQGKARKKLELSPLQAVDKDLAFVVDKKIKAIDVITAAKTADRATITDVRLFDIYEGDNLPEDKKSLAITVTYQPIEKSFTDKELEVLMQKVIVAVENKCGGQLRQ